MTYPQILVIGCFVIASALLLGVIMMRRAHGAAAHANQELQHHIAGLRLLVELSELLQLSAAIEEATDLLPAFGERLFGGVSGAVYITQPSGAVELAAFWGEEPDQSAFQSNDCWGARRGRMHVSASDARRLACRHAAERDDSTLVCVPMLAVGRTLGVVTLRSSNKNPHASVELFAKPFADQVALGIATLQMQESLHVRAVRDPLTGLYNRRYMEEALSREIVRLSRDAVPVGLMLIDVDHFKRFNDTSGHAAGDAVLQQLGKLMQSIFRDEDIVCRYGGEEFLVVMPGAGFEDVRSRAEYLRASARDLRIHLDGQILESITISAGIAAAPSHGSTAAALVAAADRALYAAKSSGRDRVATPPPQAVNVNAA